MKEVNDERSLRRKEKDMSTSLVLLYYTISKIKHPNCDSVSLKFKDIIHNNKKIFDRFLTIKMCVKSKKMDQKESGKQLQVEYEQYVMVASHLPAVTITRLLISGI